MAMPFQCKGHHSSLEHQSMQHQVKSGELQHLQLLQAEAEQQCSEEEVNFSSPQAKSLPSAARPTKFAPGTGGPNDPYAPIVQDLYPQYDFYNVNILDPIYDTKAHVATCPPTNTCYCGRVCSNAASLKAHQDKACTWNL